MKRRHFVRGLIGLPLTVGVACKSKPEPEPAPDLMPYACPPPCCPICGLVLALYEGEGESFRERIDNRWYECSMCGEFRDKGRVTYITRAQWIANWTAK